MILYKCDCGNDVFIAHDIIEIDANVRIDAEGNSIGEPDVCHEETVSRDHVKCAECGSLAREVRHASM